MEMQRIDENTIKVILGPDDLETRGVSMLDLLGNRKQIENFFYSILEEVDVDHSFANNEDAVTFQVMPQNQSNGLILLISKGNNSIKNMNKNNENQNSDDVNNNEWEDFFRDNLGIDSKEIDSNNQVDTNTYENDLEENNKLDLVVKFDDFDDFIELAGILRVDGLNTDLWLYQDEYYLEMTVFIDELHDIRIKELMSIVNEYSTKTSVTPAILSEFGKKIMEAAALQLARYYFVK